MGAHGKKEAIFELEVDAEWDGAFTVYCFFLELPKYQKSEKEEAILTQLMTSTSKRNGSCGPSRHPRSCESTWRAMS